MAAPIRFLDILRTLCGHEVDFVVVGGVAAILEAVIRSKEHANRDKDRAALPLLRQTLSLKARGRSQV